VAEAVADAAEAGGVARHIRDRTPRTGRTDERSGTDGGHAPSPKPEPPQEPEPEPTTEPSPSRRRSEPADHRAGATRAGVGTERVGNRGRAKPRPEPEDRAEAPTLSDAGTSPVAPPERSRDDRVIAGVCGGLGEYLGVDAVLIRIARGPRLAGGAGLLLYAIGWPAMPEAEPGAASRGRALADQPPSGTAGAVVSA
jgi:phage shock protein PspC (stress-responsive transcriptional regulator)